MPLEMPRVAPRRKQHGRHHHAHTAAAAPWTDVEDHAHRNRRGDNEDDDDSDESSGYDDDERTQRTDRHGHGDGEDDNGCCAPLAAMTKPVEVGELGSYGYAGEAAFWIWPLFGPLLFENTSSDARDGLANERTFLSYLRLSVTMAVVAVAIVLSFHLKNQPSPLELRMARPLGIIFWLLSVLTLFVGVANYIKTVNKYSRRQAIVQSGWKTQSIMAAVALAILGSCVTLLVINRISEN
ncbi:hypothetical protein HMPREF1624_05913 [Sporothrix schenckii ATCC 58251]|uniref:DUF202 domain-containing protein n=1 Tax=Sporothrix schenckii (strain ATCC 58251 / de Perez 2211183) TaxID=1391915 RepID=U7PQ70_SPOS1|nr:hypothetical protein HMPREF1624_05913 [Sporothrix schenckii ATCC 58251]